MVLKSEALPPLDRVEAQPDLRTEGKFEASLTRATIAGFSDAGDEIRGALKNWAEAPSEARPQDICHVNGPTVHDEAQMPFGGVGASGYGRFGGRQGIDSFTETRWITIETQPGHFPI